MKRFHLLFFLTQLTISSFAQSFSFSTLREIYAFSVGDTFEYQVGSRQPYAPYCTYEGHTLTVITSFNISRDTIVYTSESYSEAIAPCCEPGCGFSQYSSSSVTSTVTNLDSTVFYSLICPNGDECLDTAFSNGNFNFHKQNLFHDNGFNFIDETYANGLGFVQKDDVAEENKTETTFRLIYFHKTTGEIWGQPQPIVSGINTLHPDNLTAQIFPVPAENNFNLMLSEPPFSKLNFLLFDASGRIIFNQLITNMQTEIERNDLSSGLYHWELTSSNQVLQRGKLVLH